MKMKIDSTNTSETSLQRNIAKYHNISNYENENGLKKQVRNVTRIKHCEKRQYIKLGK